MVDVWWNMAPRTNDRAAAVRIDFWVMQLRLAVEHLIHGKAVMSLESTTAYY
jgi:hypothetical protein